MSARAAMAALLFASVQASAETPLEEAQLAQLDRVRAEVADQVQLSAYDLVDELVFGIASEPVFSAKTPIVLAGVTVPVGLGTGLQAMVENHIADVLSKFNVTPSRTPVTLLVLLVAAIPLSLNAASRAI